MIASWYPDQINPMNGCFFQERARAWARHGCQVSVAVADVRLKLECRNEGISVNCSDSVKEYRYIKRNRTPFWEEGVALQQISMIRKIYDRICKDMGKPDLIHLESARCAYAAVKLAKEEGIPMTYTEHYSGILNSKPRTFLHRTMNLAVKESAHIFLISSAMKEKLAPAGGKWSMLPNSVDTSVLALTEPTNVFTFCALGSLRYIKGFDVLLRAFKMVREEYSECILMIGGDGPEKENLIKLSKELAIDDSVHFLGKIESKDKYNFFEGNSAFVCSSRTETFSVVCAEALVCGIPVIATKCGGPEDLIDGTNGYLVEKENPKALAEGMKKMIKTRQLFNSEIIRYTAIKRFSEDNVVKNQLEKFRSITGLE